ncbi:unnamed protein product, partial [Amoebophrya sp. A120]
PDAAASTVSPSSAVTSASPSAASTVSPGVAASTSDSTASPSAKVEENSSSSDTDQDKKDEQHAPEKEEEEEVPQTIGPNGVATPGTVSALAKRKKAEQELEAKKAELAAAKKLQKSTITTSEQVEKNSLSFKIEGNHDADEK